VNDIQATLMLQEDAKTEDVLWQVYGAVSQGIYTVDAHSVLRSVMNDYVFD
jgi:hypothetical protein